MLRIEAEGTVSEDRMLRVQLPADTPTGAARVVVVVLESGAAAERAGRIAAFRSLRGMGDSVTAFLADRRDEAARSRADGWCGAQGS